MLIYIIKFSACLAIFMVFYKLVLEKTSMHSLKRFYLLGALVLALCIPTLTFVEYIEPVVTDFSFFEPATSFEAIESLPEKTSIDYVPFILWSLYGLGAFVFLLKFCLNLKQIIIRIKNNPKYKSERFINVLVSNLMVPHTFFSYIFLNKYKYENKEIPLEVLLHEQTHAKQKHSLDVLVIELLQIVFWFNPLIYLLKYDIKLNHEFLADQAVINNGVQTSAYQNIILTYSSKTTNQQLANAINYSSIKKRFTIMKTKTSKPSIWLKSLLILPLLALVLFSFTERKQVVKENNINLPAPPVPMDKSIQEGATKSQIAAYNAWAKAINQKMAKAKVNSDVNEYPIAKVKEVKKYKAIYNIMTETQKNASEPWPSFPPPPPPPPVHKGKVNKSLVNTYNKWVKGLKNPDGTYNRITSDDYKYFISIYNNMTDEQKKSSAGLPPPPPPPSAPAKPKKGNGPNADNYTKDPIPPSVPETATPEQRKQMLNSNDKVGGEFKDNKPHKNGDLNIPPPPPPPTPISPIDHIIAMAKKEATFFYEGRQISSDGAIQLVKTNKELNIFTKYESTSKFRVFLTKDTRVPNTSEAKTIPKPTAENIVSHIKVMNRHGATFYLGEKKITFEEALAYVRKHKDADVTSSTDTNVTVISPVQRSKE